MYIRCFEPFLISKQRVYPRQPGELTLNVNKMWPQYLNVQQCTAHISHKATRKHPIRCETSTPWPQPSRGTHAQSWCVSVNGAQFNSQWGSTWESRLSRSPLSPLYPQRRPVGWLIDHICETVDALICGHRVTDIVNRVLMNSAIILRCVMSYFFL